MAKGCEKIFIGATGQHVGKTTLSVALYHLAKLKHQKVGFMKPVGQEHLNYHGIDVDKDVAMMAQVYGLEEDLPYMSPVVAKRKFTREVLDGKIKPEDLLQKIKDCAAHLEEKYDLLIIEGTGHGGVGSIFGLNNAQVAATLNAKVLLISDGGIGSAYDKLALNCSLYEKYKATVKIVMVNKLIPEKRDQAVAYLTKGFENQGITVMGGLNFNPMLANPSLTDIAALFGKPLKGNPEHHGRIIKNFIIGAANTHHVLDLLEEDSVVVLSNSRDRLLVTLSSVFDLEEYKDKLGGLIISGITENKDVTQKIIDKANIPYLQITKPIGDILDKLNKYVSKLTHEDKEKIAHIQRSFEEILDFGEIEQAM